MKRDHRRSGFTLIELILVIGILALVASIAIGKFTDLRKGSAKRVNVANMQTLDRVARTYLASLDGISGQKLGAFDKMEALLDVDSGGRWTGAEGTYDWTKNSLAAMPGIYMGPKSVSQISDREGGGGDTTGQSLDQQRRNNQGIPAGLVDKLGVYYLREADVKRLKDDVGISNYLLHNYLAGQSSLFGFIENEDGTPLENGGPGFRADMSAFYKVALTNGSPVAVLDPRKAVAIYRALGFDLNLTRDQLEQTTEQLIQQQLIPYRLFCFGLGRTAVFARNALETVPRCEVYGREYYRNYMLVFAQQISAPMGFPVRFAGVIDPDGRTIADAQFNTDWY